MRKPPIELVIDEESFRRAHERPEAKEALKRLAGHIVETFIESIPPEELPLFQEHFNTAKGDERFAELWPELVDACFAALCPPPRKQLRKNS